VYAPRLDFVSMFDFKFADRILSGPEADGWLLAGSSFSRADYHDAFDAVKYGFDNG
jgi:hypothetical protein